MEAEVELILTRFNRTAVIYQGYYFFRNRCYKDVEYWSCAHGHCPVRLIRRGHKEFQVRNHQIRHAHPPNAPNVVEKRFRQQLLRQVVDNTSASVREIYDEIRQLFIDQGVPEGRIPDFSNVRSSMYWKRKKMAETIVKSSTSAISTDSSTDDADENRPLYENDVDSPIQDLPLDLSTKTIPAERQASPILEAAQQVSVPEPCYVPPHWPSSYLNLHRAIVNPSSYFLMPPWSFLPPPPLPPTTSSAVNSLVYYGS